MLLRASETRVHAKGVVLSERTCFCLLSAFFTTLPSKNLVFTETLHAGNRNHFRPEVEVNNHKNRAICHHPHRCNHRQRYRHHRHRHHIIIVIIIIIIIITMIIIIIILTRRLLRTILRSTSFKAPSKNPSKKCVVAPFVAHPGTFGQLEQLPLELF